MSVRVIARDCREVLPLLALKRCVSYAVAWSAKSNEVRQGIRFPEIFKQTEWLNVVRVRATSTAVLAPILISFLRRPLLRLPVRPFVGICAIDELRMQLADAMRISALARAKLGLTGMASGSCITVAAANTGKYYAFSHLLRQCLVLARRRAMQAASVFCSRWNDFKQLATLLAGPRDLFFGARLAWLPSRCLIPTGNRARYSATGAIWLHWEYRTTDAACYVDHRLYIVGRR